ncbi:S16 family serine protease [Actinotalea sp. JY-7885]|uniref:YlbL family protein n=1 Tax=Actinotalea sp. JY-7885 TaxID=2758576 RepID=UPI00165EB206|nr:S16 family serine protease [Actinotalea sp. JY-7885]
MTQQSEPGHHAAGPPDGPFAQGPFAEGPGSRPEPAPLTPRAITASVATVVTAVLLAVCAALPLPYAIESPGPTRDTLGEDDGTPLITVEGAPTFDSSGELLLTTVRVAGGPGSAVSLPQVVASWFDRTRAVVPVEQLYPSEETREEVEERNQAAMASSQENATVAALEELGYEVPTRLVVADAVPGSGSEGVVLPDDVIVSVDGTPVDAFSELDDVLGTVEPGADVVLGVERDGEPVDLRVTTTQGPDGTALLGVYLAPEFELPVDVTIEIDSIGGPSAGTMFALGIIDRLTEADETGGQTIAGTGTMDLTGAVGPIGGIRQKLAGAKEDGATWFLAPEANCDEVVGYVPDGLRVASVATLAEAREAMTAIGAGRGEELPTCSAAPRTPAG